MNKTPTSARAETTLCFVGGGNMAFAIIQGLIRAGMPAIDIQVIEPQASQQDKLRALDSNLHVFASQADASLSVDAVILAVKPQIMREVCATLAGALPTSSAPAFISIAAGIRTTAIQTWLDRDVAVIRAMPNQGALIGQGSTGLFANEYSANTDKAIAERTMAAVGSAIWVDEEQGIDSVTAISGSGPAYFFLLMELMQRTGESFGLPATDVRQLVTETALAAAALAAQDGADSEALRRTVTSPGGTTAAAVEHMLDNGIDALLTNALKKARERAGELADNAERAPNT
ncbi:MAG: pyrroline-5-carboxylate reductase [Woeseiaceae bacterium]